MGWDIFLSHSSRDLPAAEELRRALEQRGVHGFLSPSSIQPGDLWGRALKGALSQAPVIAVLASPNTEQAYFQMAEILFAIDLLRADAQAHRVVPILLRNASPGDLPLELRPLHMVREGVGGMADVADQLATLVRAPSDRSPAAALGGAAELGDEIWSRVGPAFGSDAYEPPPEFSLRYAADGADLVMREGGQEAKRVTGAELERMLRPDQLEHIAVLERSMWVNRIVWDRAYPNRVLDPSQRATADEALDAMGEDLAGVVQVLLETGLKLDDHYLAIRQITARHAARR